MGLGGCTPILGAILRRGIFFVVEEKFLGECESVVTECRATTHISNPGRTPAATLRETFDA